MGKNKQKTKYTSIGGQALIEGVMMRSPEKTVVAVRTPDQNIVVEEVQTGALKDKSKFFKIPLLRGVVGFVESMLVGYKTLMRSAELSGLEDLEEGSEEDMSRFERWLVTKFGEKLMKIIAGIAAVFGVALSIVLFMFLPSFLFNLLQGWVGNIANYRALFEGLLKIGIFLLYIVLISRMKEIRRVFEYHGAEHKTIFCLEAKEELTVENVRRQSRFHPRCGTSFLLLMLLVGIVFSFLLSYFTRLDDNIWLWTPMKILIVPVIMGVGYEVLKITGRYDNVLTRIVAAPGMWMQRLTTKEPDSGQIEVAIASIKAVLPNEEGDPVL